MSHLFQRPPSGDLSADTSPDQIASSPRGAVAALQSPRSDLLVFEILHKIQEPDIEWMARRAEEGFERDGGVDMLLVMRNYQGATLGAVCDGQALKAQADATRHVRRYAIVGAPAWARAMIEVSGRLSPVETKSFALTEEADAWAWVGTGSARAD